MEFHASHIYHVYNQGNNQNKIYFQEENYVYFLKKMKKHLTPHSHILAWCLMPNHFHWLIKIIEDYKNKDARVDYLNRSIGSLLSSYTQAVNKNIGRSGSLFRDKTKAKRITKACTKRNYYGLNCFLYIHQNPLKAGLVSNMEDWEYSSFRDYAGMRDGQLCNKELAKDLFALPENSKEFLEFSKQTIPESVIKHIF